MWAPVTKVRVNAGKTESYILSKKGVDEVTLESDGKNWLIDAR